MINDNLITAVSDMKEQKRLTSLAFEIISSPMTLRQEYLREKGWVAVPVESAAHFDKKDAVQFAKAFASIGCVDILAVATESLGENPLCYRVKATQEGLLAFSKKFGFLNFVLMPEDLSFLILCTTSDFFIVAGPTAIVEKALGKKLAQARADFVSYASSSEWDVNDRARLLAVAKDYE